MSWWKGCTSSLSIFCRGCCGLSPPWVPSNESQLVSHHQCGKLQLPSLDDGSEVGAAGENVDEAGPSGQMISGSVGSSEEDAPRCVGRLR
jgi:hypothetical protein